MLSLENRRGCLRLGQNRQVLCNGKEATLINLSPSGARLVIPLGTDRCRLRFELGGHRFQLQARCVWRQALLDGENCIAGVRFEGLGEVERHELCSFVIKEYYQLAA